MRWVEAKCDVDGCENRTSPGSLELWRERIPGQANDLFINVQLYGSINKLERELDLCDLHRKKVVEALNA